MQELVQTKQDIRDNVDRITPLITVLEALAYGVSVEVGGWDLHMQEGAIYIKGGSYNTKTMEQAVSYLGVVNDWPYIGMINMIHKKAQEDPKWLEELRLQKAIVGALNEV